MEWCHQLESQHCDLLTAGPSEPRLVDAVRAPQQQ